ncbi:amidohydrolase family protein [Kushneria phosphatilytica]|uniref:Amidohydrolase family protein n=1 Tax=Kushneria phosphatilytica TaxID=657387 RepID=A0A1S1NUY7_9GAMM|nr:amidohydrolase family protein [Kushneria phosphatilytica]OHV08696.1 amidohydrolase [Kushneria phosphatilytica]QEL12414.1 amidohydrolase family protein [Kushneria phosphatilytica]
MPSPHPRIVRGVDAHAHIFSPDLPMVPERRYSPDYEAPVAQYLAHLDRHGLSHGMLVQPSFLGTDNGYMLAALRQYGERLRGTAVVEPEIDEAGLDELQQAGVVSIRLNLIGRTLDDYGSARWQRLFARLVERRWSLEIQRGAEDLGAILPTIQASGVSVVIDHFGLPKGPLDATVPEHRALLDGLAEGRLWVKLSAAYRSALSEAGAQASLETMRQVRGGLDRFVWGSDWPHTRFETHTDYDEQFALLQRLLPDADDRQQVLVNNPARLFGLDGVR